MLLLALTICINPALIIITLIIIKYKADFITVNVNGMYKSRADNHDVNNNKIRANNYNANNNKIRFVFYYY